MNRKKWIFIGGAIFVVCVIIAMVLHAGTNTMLPNNQLTPGKVNPNMDKDTICSKSFRTGVYRNVSESTKKKVFARYQIPYSEHSGYEVDHLISLELGGSNDIENLWPEPYEPRPGAHEKDIVENWLHEQVCSDKISLDEARSEIIKDWLAIYEKISQK